MLNRSHNVLPLSEKVKVPDLIRRRVILRHHENKHECSTVISREQDTTFTVITIINTVITFITVFVMIASYFVITYCHLSVTGPNS